MFKRLKLYGIPVLASHIKTLTQAKPRTSAYADGARVKNTTGFTIIEVVIVLAIAGLIFAVVFIAVPQLQAAQRDTARQDAMGRFEAAVTQYQSRNGGDVPSSGDSGIDALTDGSSPYLNDFADPIGGNYSHGHGGYEEGEMLYNKGFVCDSPNSWSVSPGGTRNYTVRYELEQGGRQCRDNT